MRPCTILQVTRADASYLPVFSVLSVIRKDSPAALLIGSSGIRETAILGGKERHAWKTLDRYCSAVLFPDTCESPVRRFAWRNTISAVREDDTDLSEPATVAINSGRIPDQLGVATLRAPLQFAHQNV